MVLRIIKSPSSHNQKHPNQSETYYFMGPLFDDMQAYMYLRLSFDGAMHSHPSNSRGGWN